MAAWRLFERSEGSALLPVGFFVMAGQKREARLRTEINQRGVWLLLAWAGKATTKSLSFAPRLGNILAKASELVCHVNDGECDHCY